MLKNIKHEVIFLFERILINQNKPLSPGEVLGCTCSRVNNLSNILYIGDGRFHLEAIIIANPLNRFFQFNPFSQKFTNVEYNLVDMFKERQITLIKALFARANTAVIIGLLGRQGNHTIVKKINELVCEKNLNLLFLTMTEISPDKIEKISSKIINIWAQIACPRLSIDWSSYYQKPLLTTYELVVLYCFTKWKNTNYPMDCYSYQGGHWANYTFTQTFFILKKSLIN
jgi:2-(3-amino-3-carboxypropyl)histidine synthase